jgi:uncharacterized surface protein with fasciclin (FAS1) repeats
MKKTLFRFPLFIAIAVGTMSIVSCKKDKDPDPVIPEPNTITKIVVDNPNFSFLEAAVVKADLAGALKGTGPFTVFAPTNAAFIAAGFPNEAAVTAADKTVLEAILKYHVLTSKVESGAIATAVNSAVPTLAAKDIFVTKTSAGSVNVNGAKVTTADVQATNGVIHIIDAVLIPPALNIPAYIQANYTFLYAAVVRASSAPSATNPDLAAVLSGTGPFTIFAPTNAAFIAAGFPNIAAINAAPVADLNNIIKLHGFGARIYSNQLANGASSATIQGATLTFSDVPNAPKVKGPVGTAASITKVNLMTTNGVIHEIDKVLLP